MNAPLLPARVFLICFAFVLMQAGCSQQSATASDQDLLSKAEAEATQIIQEAQATALVLQAQTQATALMAAAGEASGASEFGPTMVAQVPTVVPDSNPTPEELVSAETPDSSTGASSEQVVQILSVGFAAEGGLILVQFIAPPKEAEKWWQGSVSVTDEANGAIYNEIPLMPKIGPLIGRPKQYGQIGYVMLVNAPPYLQSGAIVTVKLGNYVFEHVQVQ